MNYQDKENYITVEANVEFWAKHLNSLLLEDYRHILNGTLADFGCNHGACSIIAARNSNVSKVIGLDINPAAIEEANKLLKRCKESQEVKDKLTFMQGNLEQIPLADNSLDCATMFHTFEHIWPTDYDQIIGEIRRVLKPDAALIVSVPFEHAYDDPYHHKAWFSEESLTNIFKYRGFNIVELKNEDRARTGACLNLFCRKS